MIVKDQNNTIEQIGNVTEESQFKIKVSPKAFQILSSLYSDKPLAIVRELGCNAMDSHIASGQSNRPLHVHIPNTLEPWLTIQDFGTGISHENIYKIYTEYFNSTKTTTNDQVGMLGLGSKSPFCYTDNFTITSIHEGVKRIYNAYFNQAGVPTISLASQENTTDHNGVAIQIPVKQSDMGSFSTAVFRAFRFFDVKPTITGGDVEWDTDKPDFEGTFWKSYTKLNQSYAIMGGVAYPIDTYKIDNDHYDIIRKAGLVIKFNVGELDVTPSRESLMYHDWVLEALNNKITLVKKDFATNVEENIKNAPNLLDALKNIYRLKDQWSFLNSPLITGKVSWKSVDISDPRRSIKALAPTIKSYSKKTWGGRAKHSESEYPCLHNSAEWYYDNLKSGSIKRCIHYVRNHADSNIAVNLITESEMKQLIKSGFSPSVFVPTSNLPSVQVSRASRGKGNTRPKGIINVYDIGPSYRNQWTSRPFNLANDTAPKYYIVKETTKFDFNAGKVVAGTKEFGLNFSIQDKNVLEAFCEYAGINIKDVCMVAKTNAIHLESLGSENFSNIVTKKSPTNLDWEKIEKVRHLDLHIHDKIVKHKLFSKLDDENPLKVFVNEMDECVKEIKKLKSIARYVTSKEKELTFPSNIVRLIYLACDTWQVGLDVAMNAALDMNKTSK